jgi:hypothetical protein
MTGLKEPAPVAKGLPEIVTIKFGPIMRRVCHACGLLAHNELGWIEEHAPSCQGATKESRKGRRNCPRCRLLRQPRDFDTHVKDCGGRVYDPAKAERKKRRKEQRKERGESRSRPARERAQNQGHHQGRGQKAQGSAPTAGSPADKAATRAEQRLDKSRTVGIVVREQGRFGSPATFDGMDDESDP